MPGGSEAVFANAAGTAVAQEYRTYGNSTHAGKVFRRDLVSGSWTGWSSATPIPTLGGSDHADDQTTFGTYHRTGASTGTAISAAAVGVGARRSAA